MCLVLENCLVLGSKELDTLDGCWNYPSVLSETHFSVCPFTVFTHNFWRIFRHSFLFLPSHLHCSSPSLHQNTSPKWLTPSFFILHSCCHPGRAKMLCMLTKWYTSILLCMTNMRSCFCSDHSCLSLKWPLMLVIEVWVWDWNGSLAPKQKPVFKCPGFEWSLYFKQF